MTARRRFLAHLGIAAVAGAVGFLINQVPMEGLARLWPGRVAVLPVARFLGPWAGAAAAAIAALSVDAQHPGILLLLIGEGALVGWFARNGRSRLAGGLTMAAIFFASMVLYPALYGLPAVGPVMLPLALKRLLDTTVAPGVAEVVNAILGTKMSRAGRQTSPRPRLRGLVFHAFVLMALVPVLLVSTVSAELFSNQQRSEAQARLEDTASSLADRVNTYLDEHLQGISALAAAARDLDHGSAAQRALLDSYKTIYAEFSAVAVADATGLVREILPATLKRPGMSVGKQPFFSAVASSRQRTISGVALSPATGAPLVFVGAPIPANEGTFVGIAHASLRLSVFESFVQTYLKLPDGLATILDGKRKVIFASQGLGYKAGDTLPPESELAQGVSAGTAGEYLSSRGIVTATGWSVYVQQPRSRALAGMYSYYALTMGALLMALVASIVGGRMFSATITSQLEGLVDVVTRTSLDRSGGQVAVPDTATQEVAALTDSINRMEARLSDSYAQLESSLAEREALNRDLSRLADELEANVQARTGELARTTQVMENIIGALPGALLVADGDGVIRICNDTAATLIGRSTSEIQGAALGDVFDGATLLAVPGKDTGGTVIRTESSIATQGGERIAVLVSSTLLDACDTRDALRTICIAIDVSDRKKLEAELHQAQKLESVGRLAAGVAHEINTPTQFVSDSVQFIKDAMADLATLIGTYRTLHKAVVDRAPTDDATVAVTNAELSADLDYLLDQVPAAIDRSLDGLGRVTTIVRSMKEFAHPDRREMSAVDLNQAIGSTLVVSRSEYKYVADVATDFGDLPPVLCHASDVNQAVLNIVVNAAHAIGEVVAGTDDRGRIEIQTRRDGEAAVIRISDTGGGIPDAIRARVFDPFFTTKGVGKGTGQGLAIARSVIVDKHGGEFTFETETGHGTTFIIRLPIQGRPSNPSEIAA